MGFKELTLADISDNMLDKFERYEEIKRAWRTVDNKRILEDISYIEHWNNLKLSKVCCEIRQTLLNKGSVFAVFDNDNIVGFASLENNLFGREKQYLQLSMLHVSKNYRKKGIGKILFEKCIDKSIELGANKIYISASSCENAQLFYGVMGCVEAVEVNPKIAEIEPFDCQMEYVL